MELQEEIRQRKWDTFLRKCPRCSCCGEEITELPYLHCGRIFLCQPCVFRSMVDTEEI